MNRMTPEDAERFTIGQISPAISADVLFFAIGECDLGKVLVARSNKGVCAIFLGDMKKELEADLARRFPKFILIPNELMVKDDLAKVSRYVKKPSEGLRLDLDMRGTPLQKRIWEKARAISVGRTISYSEFGRWIGPCTNARVIANALAANAIALAIPCHRVVGADGGLAGFRWGIERKGELIRRESVT
jgi:AraC family transcriptional regulator, regulatory protein of adaptative response / methylated-DNA-[protein]-cysteine methyltransferase